MEYPTVPGELLDGWEECVRKESTVFRLAGLSVVGHTVLYEDATLRDALAAAGWGAALAGNEGGDRIVDTDDSRGYWRFFFATGLSFRPPLTPGVGPRAVRPTVVAEARRSFQRDLESRGFESVERDRSQRVRTDSGDRARLVKYTAHYPFEDEPTDALGIEGWLAVWSPDGSFRIAGGAYPTSGIDKLLADLGPEAQPNVDPSVYRTELIDLIRAVE